MAKNQRFTFRRTRSLPVPASTASGAPVKVGSLMGVTLTKEGDGRNPSGYATVALDGCFDLIVTGALAAAGTPVYIDGSNNLTATASGNTLFGYSVPGYTADGTKGSGSGVVSVEISQV